MTSGDLLSTSALITRLIKELQAEFPGWAISREDSGRWVAIRSRWGALYGQSASELRDRLRQHSPEVGGDD